MTELPFFSDRPRSSRMVQELENMYEVNYERRRNEGKAMVTFDQSCLTNHSQCQIFQTLQPSRSYRITFIEGHNTATVSLILPSLYFSFSFVSIKFLGTQNFYGTCGKPRVVSSVTAFPRPGNFSMYLEKFGNLCKNNKSFCTPFFRTLFLLLRTSTLCSNNH